MKPFLRNVLLETRRNVLENTRITHVSSRTFVSSFDANHNHMVFAFKSLTRPSCLRLDRPRFTVTHLIHKTPLLSVRSTYLHEYPSHPQTACTILNMYADNPRRLYHMVNVPAELQGHLVDIPRSPVNTCQVSCYPIGLVCASSAPIPVFVFAGGRQGGC